MDHTERIILYFPQICNCAKKYFASAHLSLLCQYFNFIRSSSFFYVESQNITQINVVKI